MSTAVVVTNRVPVSAGWEDKFEERFRKRVHLVGAAEAGQVTSIVRYEPGATFPPHDHPTA